MRNINPSRRGLLARGFLAFLKIGLFTIGGGYAMIPMIRSEIVKRQRWIEEPEFLDLMALSQAMPGVFAVNFSICIGHRLRGIRGSLAFASGVILPSLVIILLLAMFFHALSNIAIVEAMFKGVRPAVVALIAVPCVQMAKVSKVTFSNCWIVIAVATLIAVVAISPVYVIIAVAVVAFLYRQYFRED